MCIRDSLTIYPQRFFYNSRKTTKGQQANRGSPGKRPLTGVMCVYVAVLMCALQFGSNTRPAVSSRSEAAVWPVCVQCKCGADWWRRRLCSGLRSARLWTASRWPGNSRSNVAVCLINETAIAPDWCDHANQQRNLWHASVLYDIDNAHGFFACDIKTL